MKRLLSTFKTIFVISFLSMVCLSCNKDEPYIDEPKNPTPVETPIEEESKIEYYVKYESSVSIPSSNYITIDLDVVTEKGRKSLSVPRSWEGIFGPFNELTTLSITSKTSGYNVEMTSCRGRISICRGNQPFILKADESFKGTTYTVRYTVKESDLK